MTIRYNGRVIPYPTSVRAKGSMLAALTGGPRTSSLELNPHPEDSIRDQVMIISSYGLRTLEGAKINSDPICRNNGISWSKERL